MSLTVPDDTESWVEAQAAGFHGERTDPFPDALYTANKDVSGDAVAPTIAGVVPASGPEAGGTEVTITGEWLYANAVTFGGSPATITSTSGDGTSVVCTAPAGLAGAVDVTVVTPVGSAVGEGAFTYEGAPPFVPALDSVAPATLPLATVPPFQVTFNGNFEAGLAYGCELVSVDNQWTETMDVGREADGSKLYANFAIAPLGAPGVGYAVVKNLDTNAFYTGQTPWTWT